MRPRCAAALGAILAMGELNTYTGFVLPTRSSHHVCQQDRTHRVGGFTYHITLLFVVNTTLPSNESHYRFACVAIQKVHQPSSWPGDRPEGTDSARRSAGRYNEARFRKVRTPEGATINHMVYKAAIGLSTAGCPHSSSILYLLSAASCPGYRDR